METLALLLLPLLIPYGALTLVNRALGREVCSRSTRGCVGLGILFCMTGVGHFVIDDLLASMTPPWMPAKLPLIYITGVMELAAGAAVFIPRFRVVAAWAIIGMLVLFFPANVYAAMERIPVGEHAWGPVYLLLRTPLQAFLVWWAWWFAIRKHS